MFSLKKKKYSFFFFHYFSSPLQRSPKNKLNKKTLTAAPLLSSLERKKRKKQATMADVAPAPAPTPDLTTSILPAGGVDANALDASFTLVSEE